MWRWGVWGGGTRCGGGEGGGGEEGEGSGGSVEYRMWGRGAVVVGTGRAGQGLCGSGSALWAGDWHQVGKKRGQVGGSGEEWGGRGGRKEREGWARLMGGGGQHCRPPVPHVTSPLPPQLCVLCRIVRRPPSLLTHSISRPSSFPSCASHAASCAPLRAKRCSVTDRCTHLLPFPCLPSPLPSFPPRPCPPFRPQLCVSCRIVRPLRAKHCSVTDRCIEVYDHFCPWVGNAIGKGNRHYFLLFVWFEVSSTSFLSLL